MSAPHRLASLRKNRDGKAVVISGAARHACTARRILAAMIPTSVEVHVARLLLNKYNRFTRLKQFWDRLLKTGKALNSRLRSPRIPMFHEPAVLDAEDVDQHPVFPYFLADDQIAVRDQVHPQLLRIDQRL
jgi:hypothetical protein